MIPKETKERKWFSRNNKYLKRDGIGDGIGDGERAMNTVTKKEK